MKSYLRHNKEDWLLPRHFMIREELEPEFLSLLGRMLEFYRMNNDYGEMMLRYLFPVFLLYLRHNASPVTAAAKEDSLETGLQNAARFIGANYMRPITLKDAAREAGFTPTYFSKKFKELAGISFKDYLTHLRLKESVRLLRSTRMSIQEIAEACGFSGSNYFGDVFHSVYGVSPREYRKKEEV
jgi:AraC-like DNA-binding protein